jgi:parallel beta-helix repeat protein
LVIEPGVEVLFTGHFRFTVEGGLEAKGTKDDEILFTRAYPTELSKWRGFRFQDADSTSLLEYCRIEYAKGIGEYPEVRGGGIWIDNCSPTIRHCRITLNYTHNENFNGAGGGICVNRFSNSVIEFNHLFLNKADSGAGILVGADCNPMIRFNLIENNEAFYAGGGIYVSAGARSTIEGNVIRGNSAGAWGGGGINLWSATWLYGTYSYVYNNLIVNNTASDAGGGIYSRYETSYIYNNTIAGNLANRGGGLYVLTFSYLPPWMFNSILWNNTASDGAQIYLDPAVGSSAHVTWCDVEDGWPGTGNIDADPLFVDQAAGDYHLVYDSPCRDMGSESVPYMPGEDFEGDPRVAIEAIDMGADEFYTHLYQTGDATPGGTVEVKLVGAPGTFPVGLWFSSGLLDPPQTYKWGVWYLAFPVVGPVLPGPIPGSGVAVLQGVLPGGVPGPYDIFMQAMIGNVFTNLFVMEVR